MSILGADIHKKRVFHSLFKSQCVETILVVNNSGSFYTVYKQLMWKTDLHN